MATTMPNTPDRPSFLADSKSLRDLVLDLRKAELWLAIAATAAFLASAFFVVKYFVGGDMAPEAWDQEQWMNALLGFGITAVITAAQAFLYASGYKGHAAVLATCVVVFFGLFSEISQSMEREDATVRHRSESSPVFQAALGSIGTVAGQASRLAPEQQALAGARAQLAHWQGLKAQKQADHGAVKYSHRTLDRHIADHQRRALALEQQVAMLGQNQSGTLSGAIAQAKALEYDEDKHYAMIRLIRDFLGVSGIWAAFLFSVVIIGTFEYAFHFVGAYVADHKAALRLLGRDTQGQLVHGAGAPPVGVHVGIPKDYGNGVRDAYLDWVSPERGGGGVMAVPIPAAAEATPMGQAEPEKVADLTQKRFFKIIYTDVRNRILNGEVRPTVRPVTDAVSAIIKEKGGRIGMRAAQFGKPQRQEIAEAILAALERETVVQLNAEGGVGKPKYVLSPRFGQALDRPPAS